MRKFGYFIPVSLLICGCAPINLQDVTGFVTAYSNLDTSIGSVEQLEAAVYQDFVNSSKSFAFISNGKSDCESIPSPEIVRVLQMPKIGIVEHEKQQLAKRVGELEIIAQYSKALTAYTTNQTEYEAAVVSVTNAVTAVAGLSASVFPAGKQVQGAVSLLGPVAKTIIDEATAAAIRAAATKMQKPLKDMLMDMEAGLLPLSQHATYYYKAWQICEITKLNYIRDFKENSGAELDNLYIGYAVQDIKYATAIPQNFKKQLDAIQAANDKLTVITTQQVLDGTQELFSVVGGLYGAYQKISSGN